MSHGLLRAAPRARRSRVPTYTLAAADATSWNRVLVTATNSGGSTSRYSLPTYQIKAAPVLAAAR